MSRPSGGTTTEWPLPFLNWSSPYPPTQPLHGAGAPPAPHAQNQPAAPAPPPADTWVVEKAPETPQKTTGLRAALRRAGRTNSVGEAKRPVPSVPAAPSALQRPPEKPLPVMTQSEDEVQQAIKLSAEEDQSKRAAENAELQRALAESEELSKGKGREAPSTDSDELELAMAMSASAAEAQNNQRNQPWSSDGEDEMDEQKQIREWERLQQMRLEEMHRQSMFDRHDTSSLSIITERTEQPYSTAATPYIDQQESGSAEPNSPSYFGLWFSPDAKGVLEQRDNMAMLPPLSEMMAARPQAPRLPPRPLPAIPASAPHTPVSEDPLVPMLMGSKHSSSPHGSVPHDVTPAAVTPARALSDDSHHTFGSPQVTDGSHYSEHSFSEQSGYDTAPQGTPRVTPIRADTLVSEPEQQEAQDATPSAESAPARRNEVNTPTAEPEVVWPQQYPPKLPPGARPTVRPFSDYSTASEAQMAEDEQLVHPQAVRFGFLTKENGSLPPAEATEPPFPDVIQLSNMPDADGKVQYATFGMDAATWSGMLRFLNWHKETRIEAHPRDIASEKYGCGETELAAQFLPDPSGQFGRILRITIRLLPANPHARRRSPASSNAASTSKMMDAPKLDRKSTNAMSLPDHLTLPVSFGDVAAMLSTLRHLAFIAAATAPAPSGKRLSGHTTVNTLRSLGLKIAELSHENTTTEVEKADSRVRFRDKLKSKFGRSSG